ncbi:helix-turn-helix domain-containing protein [Streptomyces sp. NPDC006733]|uniref:helix-turn-helix domain-containing protein n=1 Tax=Streptomyces sp. NPDC006733 TaxID=3155460 RepID=UPI003400E59D
MQPHRIVVPLTGNVPVFEAAVAFEVFGRARRDFPVPWYEVKLCAMVDDGPVRTAEGLSFDGAGLAELERADTVIVPACADLQGDPPPELLDALRAAHARGARIASICTGAFTLAAAGLLDGRRATTHWMHAAELTARWPAVLMDPHVLYTQDEGIFTSAGECAGLDLCLHLVRLDHGSHVANTLARRMVISPHREGGQAQYIDRPVPASGATSLAPVLEWARTQLHRPLTIDDLAARAAMSKRSFLRHFRAGTGTTPLQWLVHERVARARDLLETTNDTVDRVAERCGFGSAQSLRVHFARINRTTPYRYRQAFDPAR